MSALPLLDVVSRISERAYLLSGLALSDVIRFINLTSLCHPVLYLAKSIRTPRPLEGCSSRTIYGHDRWTSIRECGSLLKVETHQLAR